MKKAYSKLERLLSLERKCMANLVQVEQSLVDCIQRLAEDHKSTNEVEHMGSIAKISNELSLSLRTHSQLENKLEEVGSRLNDILRAKENSGKIEIDMMLFVLETGLRQSRTGLLAKFTKSPPTSSTDHSPPLINQRRCSFQPQNDDTLQLVTNNPFETASSTNTDLRDIDIDEEEGSLKGELKYEDLSVENYSNPFGQQGSQGGQESPSPPPLRGMSVSVNGAELGGSGGPKVSSSFVSSEKCRDSTRTPYQLGEARNHSFTKTTSSNRVHVIDPSSTESSLSSIALPAVSPMAVNFAPEEGEVVDEEKSKKKKKREGAEGKPLKEKKKKKTKEKGKPKPGRVSPLEETIRKQQVSLKNFDDSSDSKSDSSSFGTPVRGAWDAGYGYPPSGLGSSCDDVSDNDSLISELPTYHNPFGSPEPANGGLERGSGAMKPMVGEEDDEEGKRKKGFTRGSVIDGIKGPKKKPSPKSSPKGAPRNHPRISPNSLNSSGYSICSPVAEEQTESQMSLASPPETPVPPFLPLPGIVDLALDGEPQYRQALVLSCSHFSSAAEVIKLLKQRFLADEKRSVAQQKVLVLLSYWIESSYFDLVNYEDSLFELIGAIQEQQERWGKTLFTKLSTKKILFSDLGDDAHTTNLKWETLNEGDLALSISHCEAKIFQRITPTELLAWNSKKKATHCPSIHQAINFSTQLSGWITSEVVKRMKLNDRVRLVEKFILLGEHLLEYRNFSGCMAIIGGLTSSAVWRMKKTWSAVNPDIFTIFGGLKKVMSHTSSYGSYRAYLKGSTPPRIPFLGVTLSDLTFIDDGNKTKFENGSEFETAEDTHWEDFVGEEKFNVSKCLMLSKVVAEFQTSLIPKFSDVYPPPQGNFALAISSHRVLLEEEAHQLSLFAEPKDPEEAMAKAIELFIEAQKKLTSLEKEHGKSASSDAPSPFLPYSPPLLRLPEIKKKKPAVSSVSEPKLKTSTLKRMPSSPLRPLTKRTASQHIKE